MKELIRERMKVRGINFVIDGVGFEDIRLNSSIKADVKFELEIDNEEGTRVYEDGFRYEHSNRFIVDNLSKYRMNGELGKLTSIRLNETDVLEDICCWVETKAWSVTEDDAVLDRLEELISEGDYEITVSIENTEVEEQKDLFERCSDKISRCPDEELRYEYEFIKYLLDTVENEDDKEELTRLFTEVKHYMINLRVDRVHDTVCIRRYQDYSIYSKVGAYLEDEARYRCIVMRNHDIQIKELRGERIENESIYSLIGIEDLRDTGKLIVMEEIK